jgi:hypothetical protein
MHRYRQRSSNHRTYAVHIQQCFCKFCAKLVNILTTYHLALTYWHVAANQSHCIRRAKHRWVWPWFFGHIFCWVCWIHCPSPLLWHFLTGLARALPFWPRVYRRFDVQSIADLLTQSPQCIVLEGPGPIQKSQR